MNLDEALIFLQQVITMIDPDDSGSVDLGNVALITMSGLVRKSGRANQATIRAMEKGLELLPDLLAHRSEFEIVQGDAAKSSIRRQKLMKVLLAE